MHSKSLYSNVCLLVSQIQKCVTCEEHVWVFLCLHFICVYICYGYVKVILASGRNQVILIVAWIKATELSTQLFLKAFSMLLLSVEGGKEEETERKKERQERLQRKGLKWFNLTLKRKKGI